VRERKRRPTGVFYRSSQNDLSNLFVESKNQLPLNADSIAARVC